MVPTAWLSVATVAYGTPFHHYFTTAQTNLPAAHKAMLCAGKVLAMTGVYLVIHPESVNAAREELLTKTRGQYLSPLGDI